MKIVQLVLRPFAFLFSLPVIGMAAYEVSHHAPYSSTPAIVGYILFCGVGAAFVSAVGVVAAFVEALAFPQLILDNLANGFLLAGAIALAVQTGVQTCDPGLVVRDGEQYMPTRLFNPPWIANGYTFYRDGEDKWDSTRSPYGDWVSRCRMAQATDAFLWFTWAIILVNAILSLHASRKKRSGSAATYV